MQNIYISAK